MLPGLVLGVWLALLATLIASTPRVANAKTRVGGFEHVVAACIGGERPVSAEGVGGNRRADPASASRHTFGTKNVEAGSDALTYGFAGEPFDSTSMLAYHRARWMDARVGRFAGMDPDDHFARNLGIAHLYTYASDNPVTGTDPSGQDDLVDVMAALTIVGDRRHDRHR